MTVAVLGVAVAVRDVGAAKRVVLLRDVLGEVRRDHLLNLFGLAGLSFFCLFCLLAQKMS